eukprot:scpid102603/ scgid25805/ Cystatin-A1; Stefin-A1
MATICGGWTHPARHADPEVQALCTSVRDEVSKKVNGGLPFEQFTADEFASQVVEGANYRIKVQTNLVSKIRIEVFKSLAGKVTLSWVKGDGDLYEGLPR